VALVRKQSGAHAENSQYREHECDLFDLDTYSEAIASCSVMINAIGIIREKPSKGITFERIHTELNRSMLKAAVAKGIQSYILISALGVRKEGISRYQTSKWQAEQEIQSSGMNWGIFRPSFVLGKGSGFLAEIGPVVSLPLVPVFGDGEYRFQPVHRDVLAAAVVALLNSKNSWNQIYELRGSESYSYRDILTAIGKARGKKKVRFVSVPVWMVKLGITLFCWLPFFPITKDQLKMLLEGNVGSGTNAVEEFDIPWKSLEESLRDS